MEKTLPIRAILSVSCALGVAAFATGAAAQSLPQAVPSPSISTHTPSQLPVETVETITGPDGVETITRTRRIPAQAIPVQTSQVPAQQVPVYQPTYQTVPYPGAAYPTAAYPVAPATTQVVGREQWINECQRRTANLSDDDRSELIGGLIGAGVGGLAGNRIASGNRLVGTLIGAAAGGGAGSVIGNALKGEDKAGYDCATALDDYLQQYSANNGRLASRTIPATAQAPQYVNYAPQGYYPYQAPAYQGTYQQPQQVVWVPVQVEQPQRVIVRETVRTEGVPAASPQRIAVPTGSKLIRE
ncbi:MAG: glycine zipper 2TM domain-containing protein [Pseudomonadota bacterium]